MSYEALETIATCMRDELAPWPARIRACEVILDRAWGEADQVHRFDGNGIVNLNIQFISGNEITDEAQITIEHQQGNGEDHSEDVLELPLDDA